MNGLMDRLIAGEAGPLAHSPNLISRTKTSFCRMKGISVALCNGELGAQDRRIGAQNTN
jgi:hypothetical protein